MSAFKNGHLKANTDLIHPNLIFILFSNFIRISDGKRRNTWNSYSGISHSTEEKLFQVDILWHSVYSDGMCKIDTHIDTGCGIEVASAEQPFSFSPLPPPSSSLPSLDVLVSRAKAERRDHSGPTSPPSARHLY